MACFTIIINLSYFLININFLISVHLMGFSKVNLIIYWQLLKINLKYQAYQDLCLYHFWYDLLPSWSSALWFHSSFPIFLFLYLIFKYLCPLILVKLYCFLSFPLAIRFRFLFLSPFFNLHLNLMITIFCIFKSDPEDRLSF